MALAVTSQMTYDGAVVSRVQGRSHVVIRTDDDVFMVHDLDPKQDSGTCSLVNTFPSQCQHQGNQNGGSVTSLRKAVTSPNLRHSPEENGDADPPTAQGIGRHDDDNAMTSQKVVTSELSNAANGPDKEEDTRTNEEQTVLKDMEIIYSREEGKAESGRNVNRVHASKSCDALPASFDHFRLRIRSCDPDHVLASCREAIYRYSVQTGSGAIVYTDWDLDTMCTGPNDSVLVCNFNKILQLKWNPDKTQLQRTRQVNSQFEAGFSVRNMHYTALHNLVVFASDQALTAVKLIDGAKVWHVAEQIQGRTLDPRGLVSDNEGRLYIADGHNQRLLVLDSESGQLLQNPARFPHPVYNVVWMSESKRLVLDHYDGSGNADGGHSATICTVSTE